MRKLISRIQGGQKGFTLIELLVVIAILGVIAAIVALNVAGFFGRGTLQAAKTELHQAQTAIIACMADAESSIVTGGMWSGGNEISAEGTDGTTYYASNYTFGPFRAEYTVTTAGAITFGNSEITGGWGPSIRWNSGFMNWETNPDA